MTQVFSNIEVKNSRPEILIVYSLILVGNVSNFIPDYVLNVELRSYPKR